MSRWSCAASDRRAATAPGGGVTLGDDGTPRSCGLLDELSEAEAARNRRGGAHPLAFWRPMPKFWIYTQALILLFVLAGMVIAVVRLS